MSPSPHLPPPMQRHRRDTPRRHARAVAPGELFAALPGSAVHGAKFIGSAISKGAAAILTGLIVFLLLFHIWLSWRKQASPWLLIPIIVLGFVTVGLVSPVFGPFVVVPSLTVMVSATVLIALRASGPARWLVMVFSVAGNRLLAAGPIEYIILLPPAPPA